MDWVLYDRGLRHERVKKKVVVNGKSTAKSSAKLAKRSYTRKKKVVIEKKASAPLVPKK